MESQITHPYDHEHAEKPIRIHHPEEEEHHEKGATKVLKKVKEKAKKIKKSLHIHGQGHEHNHDADQEEDEYEEQEPEVHGAPVYESSVVRGGVTGQPDSLSHLRETNVPAPEEIIPPGTKVFPVVSSDSTKPVEPEPLRDTSYGHEALSDPVRATYISLREERNEAPYYPPKVCDLSDRGESREAHHETMDTPFSLLSATEDVTGTFAPGEADQRKVNLERPKGLEEDTAAPGGGSDYLSGVSNYQSKVTDHTHKGGGEAGVPEITQSLGSLKVTDESHDQKSELGFERDLPTRSQEFDQKTESGIDKNSPTGFRVASGPELGKYFPMKNHELDQGAEYKFNENQPTGLGSGSIAGLSEDFPTRSHDLGQKSESATGNDSPTRFRGESGTNLGVDPPARSHEFSSKTDSGNGKDLPVGGRGYGEESGPGLEKNLPPARNDDVEVKTVLGTDLPTGTHYQSSPELSRPKERDDFGLKAEETRDETHEPKPSTYTDKIASATSVITDKALAAKNAVALKLGYSGESGGGKQESPVVDETPRSAMGHGQTAAGTVVEKLTPVYEKAKETGSTLLKKLPLPVGGSGAEETQQVEGKGVPSRGYLVEKLRPGEEDKALSEVIAEKFHLGGGEKKTTTIKETEVTVEKIPTDQISEDREQGEAVTEGGKAAGGGMVGKIKGWFGGKAEEMKPKSSESVEESSQSLGSTVGTTGFSDSGGGGAMPVQGGLQESGN